MRPSSRWTYGLGSSTRLWLSGVACGVLALGGVGVGVIFSSPAAAGPFPTFPTHPLTVGNTYVVTTPDDGGGVGDCLSGGSCTFRQAVDQYDMDKGVAPSPFLHVINQDRIIFAPCVPLNRNS